MISTGIISRLKQLSSTFLPDANDRIMDFDRRFRHDDLRYRDNIRQTFLYRDTLF